MDSALVRLATSVGAARPGRSAKPVAENGLQSVPRCLAYASTQVQHLGYLGVGVKDFVG